MIRFIVFIALFFAVLALSPLLLEEPGYVLISFGRSIFELTIYAAIFWLTAILLIVFLAYKLLHGGFKVSVKAWHKVAFAGRRRGIANFNKGLAAYMLEDYQSAEQLFAKSAEPAKRQQSAYLLAAASSAKQKLDAKTNHYLVLLEQETVKFDKTNLASLIVKIKLLMNQARTEAYEKSRALLDDNHQLIGHDSRLLSLEIDLCLVEKRYQQAVDHLVIARKDKTILDDKIQQWETTAFYGVFTDIIHQQDQSHLETYWHSIARKVKQRESTLFAYCQVLAEQNITEPLTKLITPILKKQPNTRFLKQLRSLPIKQSEPLIAIVQKHLHSDAHNAKWLSCLGHLALMSEQWSMAVKAFRSLLKLEQNQQEKQYDQQDLKALAIALSETGQFQSANDVWLTIHDCSKR